MRCAQSYDKWCWFQKWEIFTQKNYHSSQISLFDQMWQLGQIYTSDVKISSVYVETEQTSRVSALAGDLPER